MNKLNIEYKYEEFLDSCWPKGMRRPTIAEYKAANIRYKKDRNELDVMNNKQLTSIMSLFPKDWLKYFYPE